MNKGIIKGVFILIFMAIMLSVQYMIAEAETASKIEISEYNPEAAGTETLSGDFNVTYSFHNVSNKQNTRDNFIILVRDDSNYIYVSADGLVYDSLSIRNDILVKTTDSYGNDVKIDYDEFEKNMQLGIDVSAHILRITTEEGVELQYSIEFKDYYSMSFNVVVAEMKDPVTIGLGGEFCTLSNIVFTDHNAPEVPNTNENAISESNQTKDEISGIQNQISEANEANVSTGQNVNNTDSELDHSGESQNEKKEKKENQIKKGDKFYAGALYYKIIKLSGNSGNVAVVGVKSKTIKKAVIPKTVKKNGIKFDVTQIGSKCFFKCKKLKLVKFNSRKITSIGKKAFRGVNKKIRYRVPKSKLKKYSKMINKAK